MQGMHSAESVEHLIADRERIVGLISSQSLNREFIAEIKTNPFGGKRIRILAVDHRSDSYARQVIVLHEVLGIILVFDGDVLQRKLYTGISELLQLSSECDMTSIASVAILSRLLAVPPILFGHWLININVRVKDLVE